MRFLSVIAEMKFVITISGVVGGIKFERGSTGFSASRRLKSPHPDTNIKKSTANILIDFFSKDNQP